MIKAALLTIGTEITDGQIVDRNSAWISKKLTNRGIKVQWHLSVPDELDLMEEAYLQLLEKADLVFTTGGLGPTTDDVTRSVVARDRKLIFDEQAFKELEEKFAKRNLAVQERQKKQCFFPEGSQRFANAAGTADAFSIDDKVFVLPGPTREIESVWPQVEENLPKDSSRPVLQNWFFLGIGESQIAELVEEPLQGVDVGYRAHFPFVELKVWSEENMQERVSQLIAPVKEFLVESDDLSVRFLDHIPPETVIFDRLTNGLISQRLGDKVTCVTGSKVEPFGVFVELKEKDDHFIVESSFGEALEIVSPRIYRSGTERKRLIGMELFFYLWPNHFKRLTK